MLIVDAEVTKKIDENRGDMSCSEFISFLIDSRLKGNSTQPDYTTKEEFDQFQQGTRDLLRNFLEFFISYGLELGKRPEDKAFEELSLKLQSLGNSGNKD